MLWVYLHSNFFSGGLRKTHLLCKSAFRPFKVIQGYWFWYQSKARKLVRLPISTILHHFREIAGFLHPTCIPL